ncbi:MAG: lipopolysaccharide biosynthesis protein [Clostridium sp.]
MKLLRNLLIGGDENLEKRNMVWNMIGSFLYAFSSMLLTIAVIQVVGDDQGGIFTFAFTTFGQHMFMVAYFGIRPFQITDTRRGYTFGEYLGLRFFTCGAALVFGLSFVLFSGYTYVKAMTVFLMVIYKVIDGFADAYEAEFQRNGRLYLTGKSNTFRTILSVTCFLGSLIITENMVFSCGVAVMAQVAGVLVFDVPVIRALPEVNWTRRKGRCFRLMKDNMLLFFSVIMDFYIFSASKYAIDANMANSDLAVYGAIFMPTSVINLVAGFVIRPYITKLSLRWEHHEFADFSAIVKQLALIITGLTVLAMGGALILGIPVLSMLYPRLTEALSTCRLSLLLIILGGAFNAYVNLFYYSLVIMQKQRHIFLGYVVAAILAVAISTPFVQHGGILGGSLSYMILMAALTLCFGLTSILFFVRERKTYHD